MLYIRFIFKNESKWITIFPTISALDTTHTLLKLLDAVCIIFLGSTLFFILQNPHNLFSLFNYFYTCSIWNIDSHLSNYGNILIVLHLVVKVLFEGRYLTDCGIYFNVRLFKARCFKKKYDSRLIRGGNMVQIKKPSEGNRFFIGAAVCKCSSKLVFLKILQYLQESTCVGVPF